MAQEKTVDKTRVIVFSLSGLVAVLVIAVLWSAGLAPLGLAAHRVYDARLSLHAMVNEGQIHHGFPIETWFFYDRQGREVGEISGGDDVQFRKSVKAILQSPQPVGSTRTLTWELSRMVDKSDHLLGTLPEADFTIVKYWVESCKECLTRHHDAASVLQQLLDNYGSLTINLLYVDVDL